MLQDPVTLGQFMLDDKALTHRLPMSVDIRLPTDDRMGDWSGVCRMQINEATGDVWKANKVRTAEGDEGGIVVLWPPYPDGDIPVEQKDAWVFLRFKGSGPTPKSFEKYAKPNETSAYRRMPSI